MGWLTAAMGDTGALAAVLLAALVSAVTLAPPLRQQVRRWTACHPHVSLLLIAAFGLLTSCFYLSHYLRGAPRIVDATTYYLMGRTFAAGDWSLAGLHWPQTVLGRFQLLTPGGRVAAIFPPGYPALLALGWWLRHPLAVGPLLSVALSVSTYGLTRRLGGTRFTALLAAALGVLCGALRYHTADTMSHGLCALLFVVALLAASGTSPLGFLATGVATGWLVATRPVSGAVLALGMAWLLARQPRARRTALSYAGFGLGLLPGLTLLGYYQLQTTGSWLGSTQLAYYAVADGPTGCFRYGFGKGIGCLHEHGDYVARRLSHGFGAKEALLITGIRLRWHALDLLNSEPLGLLGLLSLGWAFTQRRLRLLGFCVVGLWLAYLPFYFDGSYPGGGARLLADVLPLEHLLIALAVQHRAQLRVPEFLRRFWSPAVLLTLTLLGFGLRASQLHRQLSGRDGGRPMYDPAVAAAKGVRRGLVFVATDHGFALGHDPRARDPLRELVVVRQHGDALDRWLWEQTGRPPAYEYRFDPSQLHAVPQLLTIDPARLPRARLEAESSWPLTSAHGGWGHPVYPPNACTSQARGLELVPNSSEIAQFEWLLAVPAPGQYLLRSGWVVAQDSGLATTLRVGGQVQRIESPAPRYSCVTSSPLRVSLTKATQPLTLTVASGPATLDWVELVPLDVP